MEEHKFVDKAGNLVKCIVDTIADKEYAKLVSFAQIDSTWVESGQTQKEAFVEFGKWLEEQLAMWQEDYEKPFVVDSFEESRLEKIRIRADDTAWTTYRPTNAGEELDFWFEIDFKIEKGQITATLNVNN